MLVFVCAKRHKERTGERESSHMFLIALVRIVGKFSV